MIARVVFRKRYYVKESIEQGLLKHDLVPSYTDIETNKTKVWCVFVSTLYLLCHEKAIERNKRGKSSQNLKMKIHITLHPLGVIRIVGISIKRVSLSTRKIKLYQPNKMLLWFIVFKLGIHKLNLSDGNDTFPLDSKEHILQSPHPKKKPISPLRLH